MRDDKVYRGVAIVSINVSDTYGNVIQAFKTHYLKPYDKPGPAKASVTSFRNRNLRTWVDGYVEVASKWERL